MNKRKVYVRPMTAWWLKNPFYIRYMIRESTSVFVGIYAFVLLAAVASLVGGESTYYSWLQAMTQPGFIVFHAVALAAASYHAITWFAVAPKVMPMLVIGGKKVSNNTITLIHYLVAIVLLFFILLIAGSV